ncbi:MAG: flagellar transcriptional regulator FlhD [Aeromicrobium sp.]|nr:flagellar transcriptional regulator FlhD [Burkholderiales bacterium]
MITNQLLMQEIQETNMSYLMLAQHMLREDKDQAMYRLGLSEETADMMTQLTPGQVLKIAASNMLMCRFRFDDDVVWNLLTSHSKSLAQNDSPNVSGIHAGILMAGKIAESHRAVA